jgi:hypothetical protein
MGKADRYLCTVPQELVPISVSPIGICIKKIDNESPREYGEAIGANPGFISRTRAACFGYLSPQPQIQSSCRWMSTNIVAGTSLMQKAIERLQKKIVDLEAARKSK